MSMDYGKRIKRLRKKTGLTQSQLAEIIGFKTPFYLSQLETGKRDAGLSVLNKICTAFGIKLFEFFKEEEPQVISFKRRRIHTVIESVSKEKQKLIIEYIETAKDMDTEAIKETILYARRVKLWKEYSQRKAKRRAK